MERHLSVFFYEENKKMYRLYIGLNYNYTKENTIISKNLNCILQQLDYFILTKKPKRTKYLLIENRNNCDSAIFLSFGDEREYLEFKKGIEMRNIQKHFIDEDLDFVNACMRSGGCNGCKYEKMCKEILKTKKEVKNDKIPYTKEIKLPNNNGSQKK
jgi:hypothetical protein